MRKATYHLPEGINIKLVEPALETLPELVNTNRQRLSRADFRMAGVSWSEATARARKDALSAAVEYTVLLGIKPPEPSLEAPVIATGHQPGFHHPGVWVKNHLVHRLAERVDGWSCNIVLDSDTPSGISFTLPRVSQDSAAVECLYPFPAAAQTAVEEQLVEDASPLANLRARTMELLPFEESRVHAAKYLDHLEAAAAQRRPLGDVFTLARRKIEELWGLANLELPYSLACTSDTFFLLLLEIFRRAEEFASIYNQSLADYRRRYRVRGKANPLPNLVSDGDRLELPLWIWRDGEARRPLCVRRRGDEVEILSGGKPAGVITGKALAEPAAGIDSLIELTSAGWRIRTKALASTIYMRLFLFDIFVHGIGGGNYDIITDSIIGRFFGIQPPAYAVATANVALPFDTRHASVSEFIREKEVASHMVHGPYNFARRLLRNDPDALLIMKERENAVSLMGDLNNRSEKRRLFEGIKNCDAVLRKRIETAIREQQSRVRQSSENLRYNAIVTGREYPFCIYPESLLRRVYEW